MNAVPTARELTSRPSANGRARMRAMRGEPLFLADWDRALMLHFEVAPEVLQPFVPFELDLWKGKAHVSLVAFTMRGLRPRRGGWITRLVFAPIATHDFLNVRAYVKHGGEPGIFFLAEWLPNRWSVHLGRPLFGLPYRPGSLRFDNDLEHGRLAGSVIARDGGGELCYRARISGDFAASEAGTRAEFLMERYTAFTEWKGLKRRFRVWHEPWQQCAVEAEIDRNSLMDLTGSWSRAARFVGANYSPGVRGVWMGRPVLVGHSALQTTILKYLET